MSRDGQVLWPFAPSEALAAPPPALQANPVLEYWEQRLAAHPGLDGVGFAGFGLAFNEWMYRVRKGVFDRELTRFREFIPGARVLDLGSGTGFWIEVWRTLGVTRPVASEMTLVATDILRRRFPDCRVIRFDITSPMAAALVNEQFDFISAIDVLFHITTKHGFASALGNIERLLKPGGYFVFSENVPHHAQTPSSTQVNRTLACYRQELHRHSLRIVRRVPVFVLMNFPVDVHSALLRRFWKLFMAPLQFFPVLGHIYGCGLYPFECLLTRIVAEGPSTELLICQKV